jgi:alcohol dehydrogenase
VRPPSTTTGPTSWASAACSVQRELPALLALTASGRLDPGAVVTHHLPLDAGGDAYALFASRGGDVGKVVLDVAP